eukprot:6787717-Prymnesium_polylepis.1
MSQRLGAIGGAVRGSGRRRRGWVRRARAADSATGTFHYFRTHVGVRLSMGQCEWTGRVLVVCTLRRAGNNIASSNACGQADFPIFPR